MARQQPTCPPHGVASATQRPDNPAHPSHGPNRAIRPARCMCTTHTTPDSRDPPHGVAGASRSANPVRMSLARPTKVSPRDRQRPPQSLLECAAPGRSSQCGTRGVDQKQLRPSVLQTSELRECILAAPAPKLQDCGNVRSEQSEHVSLLTTVTTSGPVRCAEVFVPTDELS